VGVGTAIAMALFHYLRISASPWKAALPYGFFSMGKTSEILSGYRKKYSYYLA